MNKIQIFISHHHKLNNGHRKFVSNLLKQNSVYEDITPDEIDKEDDFNLSDEQIRAKIRDKYLKDVDVTIVIVGSDSKNRKFIDWETYSSIMEYQRDNKIMKPAGIVVVNCVKTTNGRSWILDEELIKLYDGNTPRKSPDDWPDEDKEDITKWQFLPDRLFHSMWDNYKRKNAVNQTRIHNPKERQYRHAIFPIIEYDMLKGQNGVKILDAAINQAIDYRDSNCGKWDLSKLMKSNNEKPNRQIFQQVEA